MLSGDEELLQRHLAGDENAFPELVQRYLRSVYNLAYRSTGNVMEAENIVQEAFARAYAALPRYQGQGAFKPWLLTITINLCRNWARHNRRAAPIAEASHTVEDGEPVDALEQFPDPAPEPLETLLANENGQILARAVDELPLPYRQAILLRYVEGLSYEELAQALALPLNTVRTHLLRGKERLRQCLNALQQGERDGLQRGSATAGSILRGATRAPRGAAAARARGPVLGLQE
jgi:RNA polymerase sigma-70 factor, ECF subfamily